MTRAPGTLFVSHVGVLGGAERSLLDLAGEWEGPREALLLAEGPLHAALTARSVPVHVAPLRALGAVKRESRTPGPRALADVGRLARVLARRAKPFEVIHANSQKAFVVAAAGGLLAQRPVVWHLRDILAPPHFSSGNIRAVSLLADFRAAAVIANSEATAEAFRNAGGDAALVHVVHNGIDAAPFDAVLDESAAAIRRALGGEGRTVLLACGRLAPWKGQHVVLDALADLPDTVLWVAGAALFGEDLYAAALVQRARDLAVQDRVHFLGAREDVPLLMRAADVVVHSAVHPEPFGRVIVEGMLARRPVIASDAGGVREIVRNGETAWLTAPGDAAALAARVREVRADANRTSAVVERARQEAEQRFSVQAMRDGVRRVLTQVVSDRRRQT